MFEIESQNFFSLISGAVKYAEGPIPVCNRHSCLAQVW